MRNRAIRTTVLKRGSWKPHYKEAIEYCLKTGVLGTGEPGNTAFCEGKMGEAVLCGVGPPKKPLGSTTASPRNVLWSIVFFKVLLFIMSIYTNVLFLSILALACSLPF